MNYFTSEPMKYFAPPASMSKEMKQIKLEQMIESHMYLFGVKTDGNWSRAVITPERKVLQTRGISKTTGTYGEVQDKVFFWSNVEKAFQNTTVILGEIYMEGCIDRQVGSILRCLAPKALERQKEKHLHWRIFDVLCYEGKDLMNTQFEERIKYIPKIIRQINSPLVDGVVYKEMDENFFDEMADIFSKGLEGAVCYKKDAIYIPGKRGPHAWETLKVKQELEHLIDCFIIDTEPATKTYTGKDLGNWNLWYNTRTGEKLEGHYFEAYQLGEPYEPITKNFYYDWPGAIIVGVYDKNKNIIPLCKVAGLTEDFKTDLRDNFSEWLYCPVTIGGMMLSQVNNEISVRHPYLKKKKKNDIDINDCTLTKILA